jgi:hypothetical protein
MWLRWRVWQGFRVLTLPTVLGLTVGLRLQSLRSLERIAQTTLARQACHLEAKMVLCPSCSHLPCLMTMMPS